MNTDHSAYSMLKAIEIALEDWCDRGKDLADSASQVYQNMLRLEAEIERLKALNGNLRDALRSIEHDARLSADPKRAHSAQMSYDELLHGYSSLAAMARLALIKTAN